MTKRKPVDEVRWAVIHADGSITIFDGDESRAYVEECTAGRERIVRVRIVEVPKKRRKK